jgi:hypothetical protein
MKTNKLSLDTINGSTKAGSTKTPSFHPLRTALGPGLH